jgi:DUF1707 SHOCT-like domain
MTDPGGERAAPAGGHGRLRASRADRERVIELLKAAFVQDRLTQDELDTRVGLALVSRTYADLADITADIPSGSAAAERAAEPAGTPARTLAKAVRRSGICMLIAFALVGVVALIGEEAWVPLAFFPGVAAVIAASGFWGTGWPTPGRSGAPACSSRRGRAGTAGDSRAGGPAAPAVIWLRPEPVPTRPASSCEPTGRGGGTHPGRVRGRHAV